MPSLIEHEACKKDENTMNKQVHHHAVLMLLTLFHNCLVTMPLFSSKLFTSLMHFPVLSWCCLAPFFCFRLFCLHPIPLPLLHPSVSLLPPAACSTSFALSFSSPSVLAEISSLHSPPSLDLPPSIFATITSNPAAADEPDTRFLANIMRELIRDKSSECLEQEADASTTFTSFQRSEHEELEAGTLCKSDPAFSAPVSEWDEDTAVRWMRSNRAAEVRGVADRFEELHLTGLHLQAFAEEEDMIREELQEDSSSFSLTSFLDNRNVNPPSDPSPQRTHSISNTSYCSNSNNPDTHCRSLSNSNASYSADSSTESPSEEMTRLLTLRAEAQARRIIFNALRSLLKLPLAPADATIPMICCPASSAVLSPSSPVNDLEENAPSFLPDDS